MSKDALIPESMFAFYWTAAHCGEVLARESPIILASDTQIKGEEHFVHFAALTPTGEHRKWVWLFYDRVQATRLRLLGLEPEFKGSIDNDARDLIQATISRESTDFMEFDPSIFTAVPNFTEEIQEVWLGFDYQRLYKDRTLRSAAIDILSAEEFLQRMKRRVY